MELENNDNITPMMQQYLDIKRQYQDSLLFYRMGDFYELFFNDAIIAAKELDITLTKRGKHQNQHIDMCGVPWHSYEGYLNKLIKLGYKVAICEQMENPIDAKKRGYKAVVRREVVRIVTPGTLIEDSLLKSKEANYLLSIILDGEKIAIAWADISTGEILCLNDNKLSLNYHLAIINPGEILISEKSLKDDFINKTLFDYKNRITEQVDSLFDLNKTTEKLKNFFKVISLDSFGEFSNLTIRALGSLLEYITITHKNHTPRLNHPKEIKSNQFMIIDPATQKNLEIFTNLSGEKKSSLIDIIDYTVSNSGARLLRNYLNHPLLSVYAINQRLDLVDFFKNNNDLRENIRDCLKIMPDLERSLSRICIDHGGPIDLKNIFLALTSANTIANFLAALCANEKVPELLENILPSLTRNNFIALNLFAALNEEVPRFTRDGNFIKSDYNNELLEFRLLKDNAQIAINNLRDKYREITGITTLKIAHNNVFGYFVEVSPANSAKMNEREDNIFIHRQTLGSGVRYVTIELKELESKIVNAKEEALKLEEIIFLELVNEIKKYSSSLADLGANLAFLDVITSFANLALAKNYTRAFIDESTVFMIEEGRHPVVENICNNKNQIDFIANDCDLSDKQRLWLLTGPNMAGKSTFLRQNALIALLAQIGSFVPAKKAYIGIVDRLFSRVGASDDLAKGHSTFMVEMIETAIILNQATKKSLVILDEIGRGTSTYDGLAIAWSVIEHLHNHNKSRTLFATHYHELTELNAQLAYLVCYTMKVEEWEKDVIFMHKIIPGTAARSYGVHVAKLAGLPKTTIKRANEILNELEKTKHNYPAKLLVDNLPLFANQTNTRNISSKSDEGNNNYKEQLSLANNEINNLLVNKIKAVNIDELSPKEALDIMYELKNFTKNLEEVNG